MSPIPWMFAVVGLLAGPVTMWAAERSTGSRVTHGRWRRAGLAAAASTMLAMLFVFGWSRFGTTTPALLAWCWVCTLGAALTVTDLRWRRLPFGLVAACAGGCLACFLVAAAIEDRWTSLLFVAASGAVVLGAAVVVQAWVPEQTGGGDTALYGAIAVFTAWWGWSGLLHGLLWASVVTAVVALGVAAVKGSRSARFPAGPPLIAGALASVLVA